MSDFYIKNGHSHNLNPDVAKETFDVPVIYKVTAKQLEDIIVTALEGGINHWAILDNTGNEWKNKKKDLPTSQYAFGFIYAKTPIKFEDAEGSEDDSDWWLTFDKLIKGIALELQNYQTDLEDIDGESADRIIQYALFGDVVYG